MDIERLQINNTSVLNTKVYLSKVSSMKYRDSSVSPFLGDVDLLSEIFLCRCVRDVKKEKEQKTEGAGESRIKHAQS